MLACRREGNRNDEMVSFCGNGLVEPQEYWYASALRWNLVAPRE
ncbi:hypothetical protein DSM3645_06801 [Blastopirellula marina DSM 3645]|uniref:Uncharacterized protein n=1 Tax=Blastopirellula marina DSM 3645 TaxID=314230 RepID=A3ZYC0_9BACT|nr:hypothetical protein DSM3645_06801 [Blastopirellula marina DSM 3645]